ncbi:MAG TPA: HAD-IA family hydrolase [Bryobacteraceae bacterium]|nr:HAD-IA family hydrolase [Bryobacteraceae bacterium]
MIDTAIRGIVFDLDGVLIQSAPSHAEAFKQVFARLGIHDFEYAPYAGWRTPEVIADVLQRRGRSESAEAIAGIAREKSRIARELLEARRPLAKDCEATLVELAGGFPLALASSGSRSSVDAFLKLTGSRSLFRSILSGEDVSNAKPDPELYVRSAEGLGLDAKECLVVEDALAGVAAARGAGSRVVAVAGTWSAEALLAEGADRVVADLSELVAQPRPVDPACWTAVIPAAGRGTRLGFSRPKILYPLGGRTILDWLLDFLVPNCASLVFVLSPEGAGEVTAALEQRIPGRFAVVIQETPTGMGDAVALALPHVKTRHAAVVWGDQVALRRESVESCMRLHQGPLQPSVTCPTVLRANPYIHFDRDEAGRLVGLKQAREGDAMPETGESDTGFFCFDTVALRRLLDRLRSESGGIGTATREFNLLPVIPLAAQREVVLTPRVMRLEETVGINTREDAAAVEAFLGASHGR